MTSQADFAVPLRLAALSMLAALSTPALPQERGAIVDIFGARTWEPPPPPPPPQAEAKPLPAAPPPLPFRFLGRIAEAGKPLVFLLIEGDQIHQVHIGDTIAGRYRVVKFAAGQLYFRYEPMKATQVLSVGGAP